MKFCTTFETPDESARMQPQAERISTVLAR